MSSRPSALTSPNPSANSPRSETWKWSICGLLLMATMLNYMDRQTLSLTITDISRELGLNNTQYGTMEFGFGMAFALGGLMTGFIVDWVPVRWMYPLVLIGWSLAGIATAYGAPLGTFLADQLGRMGFDLASRGWDTPSGQAYLGMLVCRSFLGFFEAGQWPCALVTTQRLLAREERSFGNSLLQSGAAVGAILTPLVVQLLVTPQPGTWRWPFLVIGFCGTFWCLPWLWLVRSTDFRRPERSLAPAPPHSDGLPQATNVSAEPHGSPHLVVLGRRFVSLLIVVIMINMTWQYFRAWLPKLLREFHHYDSSTVNYFTSAYYIATDAGCISMGFAVRHMVVRGWRVHRARMATFLFCALLTALSTIASSLPRGPLLLGLFLVIGFGCLGLFPNYYAFTQEISLRHQGKVTGILGATTWIVTSFMQRFVGQVVDSTGSYAEGIYYVGLAPLIGFFALLVLWGRETRDDISGSVSKVTASS